MDHHQTWSFHESLPNLACVLGINKDIIKKSRDSVTRGKSEEFCKKDVLINSAKSTGKQLCQSFFF